MAKITNYVMLLPGLISCLVFLIVPLAMIVSMSFSTYATTSVPGSAEGALTFENYVKFFTSPQTPIIFLNTFGMAFFTCFVVFLFAYPVAYIMNFKIKSNIVKNYTLWFLTVPFLIDWTIRTVAWIPILGESGVINYILMSTGITSRPLTELLFTRYTLMIIWLQSYVLFMVFPISLALGRIDPDLIAAAKVLKAPPWRVFYDIVFKLSLPGVVCGFIFVFVSILGDFVTPGLWAGGLQTMGLSIAWYSGHFVWPYASALSTILLVVALVILYILLKVVDIKKLIYE